MITSYYKFDCLPDDIKQAHGIRSKQRLDCTLHSHITNDEYQGLKPFQNKKAQMVLYKSPAKDIVSANRKRVAEWILTSGHLNFSSIYIEDMDCPQIGYGYPNAKPRLSNGQMNPLFEFRNDGYIFLLNDDYTEIEVLIVKDGRNLIGSYYQLMIDGGLNDQLNKLREQALPYFIYGGLGL